MSASQRLAELGIELPAVVAPVAAYIPATRTGNLVYTSGQLPMVAGVLPQAGKVGGTTMMKGTSATRLTGAKYSCASLRMTAR